MAAPAISYLICSMGLVVLILTMPYFYSIEVNEVSIRAAEAELSEIADYTSNTLANLFYLVNSTAGESSNMTKQLLYLPLTVQNSFYNLSITGVGDNASKVTAALRDNPAIKADAWLVLGLKIGNKSSLEVNSKTAVAGCYFDGIVHYVWLGVED